MSDFAKLKVCRSIPKVLRYEALSMDVDLRLDKLNRCHLNTGYTKYSYRFPIQIQFTKPKPITLVTSNSYHLLEVGAYTIGATHSVTPHVRTLTSVNLSLASSSPGVGLKCGVPSTSIDTEKMPTPRWMRCW